MDKNASVRRKRKSSTNDVVSTNNESPLMDESTLSSLHQTRRKSVPKEGFIPNFANDTLDGDGHEYQEEQDSMGGFSQEVKSGHMEGIPDHLDPDPNQGEMVIGSLNPTSAAFAI